MNKNGGGEVEGLGPRPALATAAGMADDDGAGALSGAQRRVLTVLRGFQAPVSLAALALAAGLHANTVREHLDALEDLGRVRRHRAAPSGRGRPAWLYEPVQAVPGLGVAEYAGLAAALAATIARSSRDPQGDALRAGLDWGSELAARMGPPARPGVDTARARVVALLDGLGFAPDADHDDPTAPTHSMPPPGGTATAAAAGSSRDRSTPSANEPGGPPTGAGEIRVRLTRCPLLDAARAYPEVVCGVHLGIVREALQAWGAPTAGTRLVPFAGPGFCSLVLDGPAEDNLAPKKKTDLP